MSTTSSTSSADLPGLAAILRADLAGLLAPFRPRLFYLYGSTLSECRHAGSDLDFAAWLPEDDGERRLAQLQWVRRALIDALGCGRVEVADLREAEPSFAADVIDGLCLVSGDEAFRQAFEAHVLRLAGERVRPDRERWAALKARLRQESAGGLIHRDKLERLLTSLLLHVGDLRRWSSLPPGWTCADPPPVERYAAAHVLRLCLEAVLGIARHLVVAQGWQRDITPRALFAALAAHGVVPAEVGEAMRLLCLLKDSLTYPEDGVDWPLVERVLAVDLDLFLLYGRAVVQYLDDLGL